MMYFIVFFLTVILAVLGFLAWSTSRERRLRQYISDKIREYQNSVSSERYEEFKRFGDDISRIAEDLATLAGKAVSLSEGVREEINEIVGRVATEKDRIDAIAMRADTTDQLISNLRSSQEAVNAELNAIRGDIGDLKSKSPPFHKDSDGQPPEDEKQEGECEEQDGDKSVELENRGGRPREAEKTTGIDTRAEARFPKPQLIARRQGGEWNVFVEAESFGGIAPRVTQGDGNRGALQEIEAGAGVFGPVRELTRPILVDWSETQRERRELPTAQGKAMFFRLLGDESARFVSRPTRGLILAVVPDNWSYDETRSGAPPIASEPFGIAGYRVHYWSTSRSALLAFRKPDGEPFEVTAGRAQFRLEGLHLADAEERTGPLFVGDRPTLVAENNGLGSVRSIVIGEEGHRATRLTWPFELTERLGDRWQLPEEPLRRGAGWYFIRLYDRENELIDSLDFRYVRGLKRFVVDTPDMEAPDKESEVHITFEHDSTVSVRPVTDIPSSPTEQPDPGDPCRSIFHWSCDPNVRRAEFDLVAEGEPVRISLETDRTWWAFVGSHARQEPEWHAVCHRVSRDVFSATSDAHLLFRVPLSQQGPAFLGFRRTHRHPLPARDVGGIVRANLHDFSESQELSFVGVQDLRLWVRLGDLEKSVCVLTVINPVKCNRCEIKITSYEEMLTHPVLFHHDDLFERLYLSGGEAIGATLPTYVVVCMECGWLCPDDLRPDRNPTTLMGEHFDRKHPHQSMHFKPVHDVADIRELFSQNHRWVWKCKLGRCAPIIPTLDDEGAIARKNQHLEEHLEELHTVTS